MSMTQETQARIAAVKASTPLLAGVGALRQELTDAASALKNLERVSARANAALDASIALDSEANAQAALVAVSEALGAAIRAGGRLTQGGALTTLATLMEQGPTLAANLPEVPAEDEDQPAQDPVEA